MLSTYLRGVNETPTWYFRLRQLHNSAIQHRFGLDTNSVPTRGVGRQRCNWRKSENQLPYACTRDPDVAPQCDDSGADLESNSRCKRG
jgi:hypothetical protein